MEIISLRIAVDFDGTIVEHKYPEIGKVKPFAFETLNALQKEGHRLILWTIRSGKELDEAVKYCRKRGIEFYAVNKSYPEEEYDEQVPRKIEADVYVDDRVVGGFPGWGEVWHSLHPEQNPSTRMEMEKLRKRTSIISWIFGRSIK